jgi:ATP-dependent protease ClpP protease subunit
LFVSKNWGAGGPATDIAVQALEMVKALERISLNIARKTGKPLEVLYLCRLPRFGMWRF